MGVVWSFLGGLVGGFFKGLFGWITERQTRRDQVELGQARQSNLQHENAAAATTRMQQAQAGPRGREATKGALKDGGF